MKYVLVSGSLDQNVDEVIYDSRKARPDSVFVCIQGSTRDSHEFIPDVLKAGCKVLVVEKEVEVPADVTVIRVENGRLALAELSAARFGYPGGEADHDRDHRDKGKDHDELHDQGRSWRPPERRPGLSERTELSSGMRNSRPPIRLRNPMWCRSISTRWWRPAASAA